jgi:transcriptional regulator with XRE-family HTH domain
MSSADEILEFLTTRRAKLAPERAGVPRYGRKRRVPGLRREEVALGAGISVEWYTRLERGVARGVSDEVLDAIGSALQLDEAERVHVADLVRTANAEQPQRRSSTPQRVRPSVARIVDVMGPIPACVTNGRLDVVYANDLAEALFSDVFRDPVRPPNLARFVFPSRPSRAHHPRRRYANSRAGARRGPSCRQLEPDLRPEPVLNSLRRRG